ncbi:chymotrypsin family serine protease [Sphingomonas immobilis]|uniref:hypothetical protein n=1 Tax=Sphingomonas immobilis TaxID=3063997 RepID=UPI003D66F965
MRNLTACFLAAMLAILPAAARADAGPPLAALQTPDDAIAQDAAEYARQFDVPLAEAILRLHAQEASVPVTDRIAALYEDRLAGISIEHKPAYRIQVYLTGDDPVPTQYVDAGPLHVPVVFKTGAKATRDRIIWAMAYHQTEIRAALPLAPSIGLDPRTGEMVITVPRRIADSDGDTLKAKFEALTGVPVQLRVLDRKEVNLAPEGGSRVVGPDPSNGKNYYCTTGFTVTDGARQGVTTAAHCPDTLTYRDPQSGNAPLTYLGQWGWGYQDVQINLSSDALPPTFYVDKDRKTARAVTAQRGRISTRSGDFVCHRGERTGYSCAVVELTDFAPAGDLCGGACLPNWVTVAGPTCKGGDSGAPVFSGGVAFGILKGGSYRPDGSCAFYFYMSVDYLPPGWTLLREAPPIVAAKPVRGKRTTRSRASSRPGKARAT